MTLSITMSTTVVFADELSKDEIAKIEELIEQLASTRDPTLETKRGTYLENRVAEAATSLVQIGPAAFPQLVAHAGDKRFSFRYITGSGPTRVMSVGEACGRIIEVQVDVFDQISVYPANPSYFWTVVERDGKDPLFKEWYEGWKERKDKSLLGLQVESVEWAIEQQMELLKTWQKDKQLKKDADRLRKILAENRKLLKGLKTTGRAIERPGNPFQFLVDLSK